MDRTPGFEKALQAARELRFRKRAHGASRDSSLCAQSEATTVTALSVLKDMLPAFEYERMLSECEQGMREMRLEDGCVYTCFTPVEG